MTETAEQRRSRILTASPETSPFQYDSAVALGYQPESWDGMYKLPTGYPILWLTRTWALVAEVIEIPGTHTAVMRRGKVKTKRKLRKIERSQLLKDARWLRKRGVAIMAELNG